MKMKYVYLLLIGVMLASPVFADNSISVNFVQSGNQGFAGGANIGPNATNSSTWNSTIDGTLDVAGNYGAGTLTDLIDATGIPTGTDIVWTSGGTYYNGDGTGSDEAKLAVGYLDDGGAGASFSVTGIPYAVYNAYILFTSDNNGDYTHGSLTVNGTTVLGGPFNAHGRVMDGTGWVESDGTVYGNYVKVAGLSGDLTVISTKDVGRAPLTGVIIEYPTQASDPVPDNGDTGVALNSTVEWTGPTAYVPSGYKVYMDPNENDVVAGDPSVLVSTQTGTTFVSDTPLYGQTYYWRVDSTDPNLGGDPVEYASNVWSFTTDIHPSTLESGLYAPGISIGNASFEKEGNWWVATPDWFDNGNAYQLNGVPTPYGTNTGVVEGGIHWQQIGTWTPDTDYVVTWAVNQEAGRANSGTKASLWNVDAGSVPTDQAGGDANTPTSIGATMIGETAVYKSLVDSQSLDVSEIINTGASGTAGDALLIQYANGPDSGRGNLDMVRVNLPRDGRSVWDPTPANYTDSVEPMQPVTLTWNQGVDPANNYAPDSAITGYTIYFGPDPAALVSQGTKTVGDESFVISAIGVGLTPYYWRVDETVGAGTVTGPIWSFVTGPVDPILLTDPAGVTESAGVPVDFIVTADASVTDHYDWKHNGSSVMGPVADGDTQTSGDYTVTNTPSGESTLTIDNLELADEGTVSCVISNTLSLNTVESAVVRLMTRRLVGWWKLDGGLTDSVTEEVAGAPTHDGTTTNTDPNFVAGKKDQAVSLVVSQDPNDVIIITGSEDYFDFYPQGWTMSAWVNTNDDGYGAYVTKQDRVGGSKGVLLSHFNNNASFTARQTAGISNDVVNIRDGDWHLVTGTLDPESGKAKLYVDGKRYEGDEVDWNPAAMTLHDEPLFFGAEDTDGSVPFDGLLDDVRVYSYAISAVDAALLYTNFNPGSTVCIEDIAIEAGDLDGDCDVDLTDLQMFVADWLNCQIVPTCLP